ncbi:SIR2 family protein, partial [Vibrio sp. 05-20-BW147]|uniref:SIR2 family NAD-dependent protein deacylase n=1 Tax=Vibrio sp. 05-20-BW147 TaxID=2575834 RepID=UPI0015938473
MASNNPRVEVSADIKPYLDDIAEKLWTNHAAIMVGAGFSKNASSKFPSWNELGDIFYEKLYGEKPESNKVRYCNVLKLADSVEAVFGRNTLNHILTSEIPNTLVEPVEIHHTLLSLPWVDVFTTNYDTLLEKATENVSSRRYDVVVNCNELVYSSSPRIIKLHGSFPSTMPFIITEEDYRKYPSQFSPFVNTVQQSLLENTLCLVGFSGDDPNFLKWIGWIRDNLGQSNSPNIYLVGLFDFSCADLKLLEKRNIVVVDMSSCPGVGKGQHQGALSRFFEYINSKNNSLSKVINWPQIENISPDLREEKETIEKQIEKFVKVTNAVKDEYPGWLIAPRESRVRLYSFIEKWLGSTNKIKSVNHLLKLHFLDNFIWCLNICLMPIFNDFAEDLSDAIFKLGDDGVDIDFELLGRLKLSLARYYREEYKWNEWEELIDEVSNENDYSHEFKGRLYYEVCLSKLYQGKFVELRNALNEWVVCDTLPQWMIKKSSLYAEVGELELAANITREALTVIRKKLNLSPIKNDVTLLSLESYAMMLLDYETKYISELDGDLVNFSERRNQFKLYQCDPWGELTFFSQSLMFKYEGFSHKECIPRFDIGSYQNLRSYKRNDYTLNALNFLRFYEEAGLPLTTGNMQLSGDSLRNGLVAVSYYYPFLACFNSIRLSGDKTIDTLFGRKGLTITSNSVLDTMGKTYLDILKGLDFDLIEKRSFSKGIDRRFAEMIPDILSRLVSNVKFDLIYDIYEYVCSVFGTDFYLNFRGMREILERVPKVVSKSQAARLIPLAIKCKCPTKIRFDDEGKLYSSIWNFDLSVLDNFTLDNDDFNYFIALMKSDKDHEKSWGVLTLTKFFSCKMLTKKQSKEFGEILWENVENDKLPKWDCLLLSAYISLPHEIPTVELKDIVKKHVLSMRIPVKGDGRSYSNIGRDIVFFQELLNCHNDIDLSISDIEMLTSRLVHWWELDKKTLNDKEDGFFGSVADEFRNRFSCLIKALQRIVLPRIKEDEFDKNLLNDTLRLVSELELNGFYTTSLYISNKSIFNVSDDFISNEIIE